MTHFTTHPCRVPTTPGLFLISGEGPEKNVLNSLDWGWLLLIKSQFIRWFFIDYSIFPSGWSKINNDHFSENRNFEHINMSAVIEGSATNRTKSYSNILIYNRVPKCGSSTMYFLLKRLKIYNCFTPEEYNTSWK